MPTTQATHLVTRKYIIYKVDNMIDQYLKDVLGDEQKTSKDYPNEAFLFVSKTAAFIRYNTGDYVWFTFYNNKYHVYIIETHDGVMMHIDLEGLNK
jgi:hypothetical protein